MRSYSAEGRGLTSSNGSDGQRELLLVRAAHQLHQIIAGLQNMDGRIMSSTVGPLLFCFLPLQQPLQAARLSAQTDLDSAKTRS